MGRYQGKRARDMPTGSETSRQEDDYCWVRVGAGWIADTGYISPEVSQARFPMMPGDPGMLNQALSWLRWNSHEWFDYVVDSPQTLITGKPAALMTGAQRAAYAAVERNETYFWGWGDDVGRVWMASVLVHEACHHRQWDEGRWHSLTMEERELECYRVQRDMIEGFVPAASVGDAESRCGNRYVFALTMT